MIGKEVPELVVREVREAFSALANPKKAKEMAAYMKTAMPFYGLSSPDRDCILRELIKKHKPEGRNELERIVAALWRQPHREDKYAAIIFARANKKFIGSASLPLYEKMIREGAWWDLVDAIASDLVGIALLKERDQVSPVMDHWIDDDDMWIRRAAILSPLRHKDQTDEARLFRYCRKRMHEKEFFIRKAIGWALRQYARTAPESVTKFLLENRDALSGPSFREAAKHLEIPKT